MTIRNLLKTYLWRNASWWVLTGVLSCDSFTEDSIAPQNQVAFSHTEYYILPQTSAVIDLKSVISQSFISASIKISREPVLGSLTEIDPFLLRYTPKKGFVNGSDQFVISAVLDNGTTVKEETLSVFVRETKEKFACGLYAVEDVVRVQKGIPSKISFLKNDRVCGINGKKLGVSVHFDPKFGTAQVIGDSIILYTPGSSFMGKDELVYRLSTANDENISYGMIYLTETRTESLPIPNNMVDVFFVNDTIGFIAGGSDIYKTINGGRSWNLLAYPASQTDYLDFQEIFFLDKDTGFAAYSKCSFDEACTGGWMKTENGGASWERHSLNLPVNSIFFTSPLTGFMATLEHLETVAGDDFVLQKIFKTNDGGNIWSQVFATETGWGELKVRFANDNLGYAYRPEDIFVTGDGGETWELFTSHDYIISVALAPENIVSASVTSNNLQVTTPSSIVRSEDGTLWTPVMDFPYMIIAHGFSPSGDLGVAIGISNPNATLEQETQLVTISKSTDKGKTWVNLSEEVRGFPWVMSVPSEDVAYILCSGKLIKYSP